MEQCFIMIKLDEIAKVYLVVDCVKNVTGSGKVD